MKLLGMFAAAAVFLFVTVTASDMKLVATRTWDFRGTAQKAELYARELSLCDDVAQYAGYFSIDKTDKKYFYYFFESRQTPASDPVIMWLTGGPGCSSLLALFSENGPCSVNSEATETIKNPYGWNSKANLLYVDQPPGTGFSTGSYDHDEAGVAEDMYNFLQAFFNGFPKFNTTFYVFGESYAGHYVPAISHRIYLGNTQKQGNHIDLAGIAIGNGLTDPEVQYAFYPDMAYNSTTSRSVVSKATYSAMKAAVPTCIGAIKKCQTSALACDIAFTVCNMALVTPVQSTGVNLYDLRIPCEYGNLCYNFTNVDTYLNRADIQSALGVSKKWESCNMVVNRLFEGDWMHNFQDQIPDLLENGIRVLVYAGDQDYICNWLGNRAWTLALPWSGQADFNHAGEKSWVVNGKEAGKLRSAKNFSFLQVYQAGHMVPMDQPEAALAMTNSFIAGTL